jgi:hypothetical protein
MLMHASLVASTISGFGLVPLMIAGVPFLTMFFVFSAALWVAAGAVALASGGYLARPPLRRQVA